jgi:drug/metabolite transporter (DMT)-like permease
MRDAPTAMNTSERVDGALLASAVLIVVAWGTNYPLMKLGMQDVGPLTFSWVRVAGGALVLAIIVALTGRGPLWPARGEWVRLAMSGVLQYGGVLGFASLALLVMPAGRTSVAVYSMPLWAALFGVALRGERLTAGQWLGLLIGAAGLALFFDPSVFAGATVVGVVLVFAAAASWGLGAVIHRASNFRTPPLSQAFFQLIASGAVILPLALVFERGQPVHLTSSLALIMVWNWLVPTSLAVWTWSRVLKRLPAAMGGQLLMGTPLVGIATSAYIFGETIPPAFVVSTALVIIGALLVLTRARTQTGTPPPAS